MNFRLLAIAILTAGSPAYAHSNAVDSNRTVRVCVDNRLWEYALGNSEILASRMFASAGVTLDWHDSMRACHGVESAIVIDLAATAPRGASPMALAQANITDDVHIVVFLDRISGIDLRLHSVILAHVLVHEITHIVQDVPRHSETGVMKAQWTREDYKEMRYRALPFTTEDIELIRAGLAARAVRRVAASADLETKAR